MERLRHAHVQIINCSEQCCVDPFCTFMRGLADIKANAQVWKTQAWQTSHKANTGATNEKKP